MRITETTVANIDGWRVGVANISRDKWQLPDGSTREGLAAQVSLLDEARKETRVSVGPGAELKIAGHVWRVTAVENEHARGSIELVQK